MFLKRSSIFAWMLIWLISIVLTKPESLDQTSLRHIANVSYANENEKLSGLASIFSPRMDFDQWKPLTGRGDPLRNDPTYDYEPPVLERVHYWADDTRLEREHYPERKSEVLMLGVSSRRPSIESRPPPRRNQRPPLPPKYEDYTYRINGHYPMTILVPPPPPPPGHQPPLYVLTENKIPSNPLIKITEPPPITRATTSTPEHLTSLYALQEANLIYQSSSTTSQNWLIGLNNSKTIPSPVSSDYAGWGPTTPLNENEVVNDTHNLILNDNLEISKYPYLFYKPMLSEAPPPLKPTPLAIFSTTFLPTPLPPTVTPKIPTLSFTQMIEFPDTTTTEVSSNIQDYYEESTTHRQNTNKYEPTPTPRPSSTQTSGAKVFDMLRPMMTMPLINGPERLEDNLYAHASENLQVFKERPLENSKKLETMQTMQPPPLAEGTTVSEAYYTIPHIINNMIYRKPSTFTHDPYLHMRFTTALPPDEKQENFIPTTEVPAVPMYLIIQGHSKVKTYSSKPNLSDEHDPLNNEIPKPNETTEVKHLHPIKEKKSEKTYDFRESRSKNLKSLVDHSIGSIEIQETDIGIKYDVSDGSDVPIEIYKKGIVDSEENNYLSKKKKTNQNRVKRQIDFEDIMPFDEDTIEEYVYNFFNGKRNSTGITGLIAQAVTSDAASVVDDLEDEEEDSEHEDEER